MGATDTHALVRASCEHSTSKHHTPACQRPPTTTTNSAFLAAQLQKPLKAAPPGWHSAQAALFIRAPTTQGGCSPRQDTHKPNHTAYNTTRPVHAAATAETAPAVKVGVQNRRLGAWQQEYYAATTPGSRHTCRAHNAPHQNHTPQHTQPVQVDPCCKTVVQAAC